MLSVVAHILDPQGLRFFLPLRNRGPLRTQFGVEWHNAGEAPSLSRGADAEVVDKPGLDAVEASSQGATYESTVTIW